MPTRWRASLPVAASQLAAGHGHDAFALRLLRQLHLPQPPRPTPDDARGRPQLSPARASRAGHARTPTRRSAPLCAATTAEFRAREPRIRRLGARSPRTSRSLSVMRSVSWRVSGRVRQQPAPGHRPVSPHSVWPPNRCFEAERRRTGRSGYSTGEQVPPVWNTLRCMPSRPAKPMPEPNTSICTVLVTTTSLAGIGALPRRPRWHRRLARALRYWLTRTRASPRLSPAGRCRVRAACASGEPAGAPCRSSIPARARRTLQAPAGAAVFPGHGSTTS